MKSKDPLLGKSHEDQFNITSAWIGVLLWPCLLWYGDSWLWFAVWFQTSALACPHHQHICLHPHCLLVTVEERKTIVFCKMHTVNEMYTHYWYQKIKRILTFCSSVKSIIFGLLKCSTLYSKLFLYIFIFIEIYQKPFISFIWQVHYTNVWLWYYCTFSADSLPSKKFASFNILFA